MNEDPRQSEMSDRALDELLARAEWPAEDESLRRLRCRWEEISPARRWRRLMMRVVPLAVAAALVLVGTLIAVVMRNRPQSSSQRIVSSHPAPSAPVQLVAIAPPYPSRALTGRDELLLRLALAPSRVVADVDVRSGAAVLVDGIVSDALWRPWQGTWPAFRPGYHAGAAEERLLEQLAGNAGSAEERVEGTRLLSAVGSPASLGMLVTLYREEPTRQAALPGVLRLADAPTLAILARRAPAAVDVRLLVAAMLRRDPGCGARLLLPLIKESTTSVAALDALDWLSAADCPSAVRRSVTAVLFDELQGPRVEDRLAAAQALGRIDGPETAARLADMAERNVSRREAVAALIWSGDRSKAAAVALEAARRSPRLASTVRSLELTMTEAKRRGGDSRS
jgi:hypothetical protein